MSSIKTTARVAGVLYLIIFLASPLAFMIGKGGILVPGDAAATANNLMASESLFRAGIAAETIVFIVETILAAILYVLLKPVSRSLSLAAAFARLGEAVVQAVNLLPSILAVLLVGGGSYLAVFEPEQLDALVLLSLSAFEYMILVWGFFFGLHLLLLGYLVYKSGYFPRLLGALLVLSSFGYLIESYGKFMAPQSAELFSTIVLVLGVLGELPFTVYLLWKGINVEKWEERVSEPARNNF
jgi:hypothetical protein